MNTLRMRYAQHQALFRERSAAGVELAAALDRYRTPQGQRVLVLGIPRGGVPVAAEVARRLGADLDVVVARKLGAPISEELAIGAVTADGGRYLNDEIMNELGVSAAYLAMVTTEQAAEAQRREARFRRGRARMDAAGRTVIIVDDGLATGATMRAAVRAVRLAGPARLVVAVPVAPMDTCADLRQEADEVVCLYEARRFGAVGYYYEDFEPTEDAEVEEILAAWQAARPGAPPPSS